MNASSLSMLVPSAVERMFPITSVVFFSFDFALSLSRLVSTTMLSKSALDWPFCFPSSVSLFLDFASPLRKGEGTLFLLMHRFGLEGCPDLVILPFNKVSTFQSHFLLPQISETKNLS